MTRSPDADGESEIERQYLQRMLKRYNIKSYERYIEGLKDNLFEEFFTRTHDHKLADMLVARVIEKAGARE